MDRRRFVIGTAATALAAGPALAQETYRKDIYEEEPQERRLVAEQG